MPTTKNDRPDSRLLMRIVTVIGAIFGVVVLVLFVRSAPSRSAEACLADDGSVPKPSECMGCHISPHRDGTGYQIRRIDPETGIIQTVDNDARLRNVDGTVRDSQNVIYGASPLEHAAWKRSPGSDKADLLAGGSVAGRPVSGFSGDGGLAVNARLNRPSSVALDDAQRLYIADTVNNRVRRINADGTIETVAGNGKTGLGPDGGLARKTAIEKPLSVAFDANGDLLIAHGSRRDGRLLRMNVETGILDTIAGGGEPSANKGDGGPADAAVLKRPVEVTVDELSGALYIAESRPILRHWNIGACTACHGLP